MADIAPMLSVLGYDPYANPPDYGKPDEQVAHKTMEIQKNKDKWEKKVKEMFSDGGDTGVSDIDRETSDVPNLRTL